MTRPRFSFRPNPQDAEHMAAWELLQSVPEGQRNGFVVRAILRMRDDTVLKEALRRVLREEMRAIPFQPSDAPVVSKEKAGPLSPAEAPIPQEMMGFLTDLIRND